MLGIVDAQFTVMLLGSRPSVKRLSPLGKKGSTRQYGYDTVQ